MKNKRDFYLNDELSGCRWDRMSKWEKFWTWIFLLSIIMWGAPVYEGLLGIDLKSSIVMPVAGVVAVISGFFSGSIFMIIESLKK